jgi:hypothetical protein
MLVQVPGELGSSYVRFLLEHGADPNSAVMLSDSTMLIEAMRLRKLSEAGLLIKYGADVAAAEKINGAA